MTNHFHFTVNSNNPKKNDPFYNYTTDIGCIEYRLIKTYTELYNINCRFKDGLVINKNNCKTKIIIYTRPLDLNCGGIVALHNLAKCINDMQNPEICAKLFIYNGLRYSNNFCNNFASIEEAIDESAVVIYPETIHGNPLNCRKVIRWILLDLGKEMSANHYRNWGKNDLVYYFNSNIILENSPEKKGNEYKLLSCLTILPSVNQYNFEKREGTCFSMRKSQTVNMVNRPIHKVHPANSFEITRDYNQFQCIEFFNKYKWFMCYDPLTFYIVIAALCGCIPVVYKINGLNKQEWIQTTAAAEYCKNKGIDNLYGIAYGQEDMEYAQNTIHLVKEQWNDILKFNKEKTIVPFLNDLETFENQKNTVESLFY